MKFPLTVCVILLGIALSEASEQKKEEEKGEGEEKLPASLPIDLPAVAGSDSSNSSNSPGQSGSIQDKFRYQLNLEKFNAITSRPRTVFKRF